MEVSAEIKDKIRKTQRDLKTALGLHQKWVARSKENENNASIKASMREVEECIVSIGQAQKLLINRLRQDLEMYHKKLKAQNKPINVDFDHRHIALQLRDQVQYRSKKNAMSLLKPSVLNELNIKVENNSDRKINSYGDNLNEGLDNEDCSNMKNGSYDMQKDDLDDDSEFIEATENFSLKDTPLSRSTHQDRRANAANKESIINKYKKSICPSLEITAKMLPSPKSSSSKSSSPSPVHIELSPAPSPPLALPLPQPGDSLTQETFLRVLGLITPQQQKILEKKRNERKKRSTTSTNKNEFVYGNFESVQKKKKNNFPYLQQNVGPPQTRSQKMRKQAARLPANNTSPAVSPSSSPPPSWPASLRIPTGLTIQAVRSPGPKLCTVCGQNESQTSLIHCDKCKSYFHSNCGSSPSSRSPSRSRSPINGSSERRYRKHLVVCPECGDEIKDNKASNWTVIPRGYSNQNGASSERIRDKLIQKRLLQEKNRELIMELRQLEMKSERLKENIQASNIEKKQLMSNQNNTRKHIKTLLDFVNKFKDTSVSLHTIPVTDFPRTKIVLNSNELLNGS